MTYNSPAGSAISFPGTTVFNASKSTGGWTDLDISAVVGVRAAFVIIEITNSTGGNDSCTFKPKGSSVAYGTGSITCNPTVIPNTAIVIMSGLTNSSGIMEWYTEGTTGTVVLKILVVVA